MAAGYRNYREAILAKADGTIVADEDLRRLRREEELFRAALEYPHALDGTGLQPSMVTGVDYQVGLTAAARIAAMHVGSDPLSAQSVLAEMCRLSPARFAGPEGHVLMQQIAASKPVDVHYAVQVLAGEVVKKHLMKVWTPRLQDLIERAKTDPEPARVFEEFITEAYKIAATPSTGALTLPLDMVPWRDSVKTDFVPTGVLQLDRASGGGLGRGDLCVVGGGTSHGKSMFAQRLLRNQAKLGQASAYISVEDKLDLMQCRMLADYSKDIMNPALSPIAIRAKQADPRDVDACQAAAQAEQQGLIRWDVQRKAKASEVCALIRKWRHAAKIDLVIVDYLQAIAADDPKAQFDDRARVSHAVSELKRTFEECGVAGVVLSQYVRDDYKDGQEPTINSCKHAGEIENEAESMVLLWKDGEGMLHVKIAKSKWASIAHQRWTIPVHLVTGCHEPWVEDLEQEARYASKRSGPGNGRNGLTNGNGKR